MGRAPPSSPSMHLSDVPLSERGMHRDFWQAPRLTPQDITNSFTSQWAIREHPIPRYSKFCSVPGEWRRSTQCTSAWPSPRDKGKLSAVLC